MKDITVCLISCGEKTEKACLSAIAPWRDRVVFSEVRKVAPQIAALKQMVDQTETEYLIELDADMILNEDAYERIVKAIEEHQDDPSWHSILFKLVDVLTEKKILALKVMRARILKEIPFEESATPDVTHYKRLTDAGYTAIHQYLEEPPIGLHWVKGRHFCYHKYRDVYKTLRVHGFEWDSGVFLGGRTLIEKSKKHFDHFIYKYLTTDDRDYLWCVAGMIDGITDELENRSKSLEDKTYRTTAKTAFDRYMNWYVDKITARRL